MTADKKIKTYSDIITGEPVELDVSALVEGILGMCDDLKPVAFSTWIEPVTLDTILSGHTLPVWSDELGDECDRVRFYMGSN